MAKCKLCTEEKKLCRSHVLPEFLYKDSYEWEGGRALSIDRRGYRTKFVQVGIREPLLCADCEDFFNRTYEEPFLKHWYREHPLPTHVRSTTLDLQGLDYPSFKLFHLSILWRASVASGFAFEQTSLGPHEEVLRQMLRSGNAGVPTQYQVSCTVLVRADDGLVFHGVLMPPLPGKIAGVRVYTSLYAGAAWNVVASRQALPDPFPERGVQEDGRLRAGVSDLLRYSPVRRFYYDHFREAKRRCWKDPLTGKRT